MFFIKRSVVHDLKCKRDVIKKDIDLDEILSQDNIMYFEGNRCPDDYTELHFMSSVRSVYSNLVLAHDSDFGDSFYFSDTCAEKVIHRGADLVMYMTSRQVMNRILNLAIKEAMLEINDIMLNSIFQPIGVMDFSAYHNLIIYSHVILQDYAVDSFKKHMKDTCHFVEIKDIPKEVRDTPFCKTFIEL